MTTATAAMMTARKARAPGNFINADQIMPYISDQTLLLKGSRATFGDFVVCFSTCAMYTSSLLYSTMKIRPEHRSITSKQEECTGAMQDI